MCVYITHGVSFPPSLSLSLFKGETFTVSWQRFFSDDKLIYYVRIEALAQLPMWADVACICVCDRRLPGYAYIYTIYVCVRLSTPSSVHNYKNNYRNNEQHHLTTWIISKWRAAEGRSFLPGDVLIETLAGNGCHRPENHPATQKPPKTTHYHPTGRLAVNAKGVFGPR